MVNDPLLQPFQLKHLTLKNRLMMTAHEPLILRMGCPRHSTVPTTSSAPRQALA